MTASRLDERNRNTLSSLYARWDRLSSAFAPLCSWEMPSMNRRQFLGAGAAGLALSKPPRPPIRRSHRASASSACGWYGKIDLLRLIQVAPVEVVSLCDVDKHMLAEAADIVANGRSPRRSHALTATIARCSRRKTSISCWWARRTIGTPCR